MYYNGSVVSSASAHSFKDLGCGYAKDSYRVYYCGNKLTDNPSRFTALTDGYAKDSFNVYYFGKKIGASTSGFKVLSDGYAKDAFDAYYCGKEVVGSSASTFKVTGNGYAKEWEAEAKKRGLLNLRSSVDAFKCFNAQKNVALFERHGVMSKIEIESREEILFENYAKTVNIEALTMIEMASRDIIPAVNEYLGDLANEAAAKLSVLPTLNCDVERDLLTKLSDLNAKAYADLNTLKEAEAKATAETDFVKRAECYRDEVIPAMEALRAHVDEMETITAGEYWPLPTYGDMMFRV